MRSKIVTILGSAACLLAIQDNVQGMNQSKGTNSNKSSFGITIDATSNKRVIVSSPDEVWEGCDLNNAAANNINSNKACAFKSDGATIYADFNSKQKNFTISFGKNQDSRFWKQRPVSIDVYGSNVGNVKGTWNAIVNNQAINYGEFNKRGMATGSATIDNGTTPYQYYRLTIRSESGEGPSFSKLNIQ